jgi:hypothetical protein
MKVYSVFRLLGLVAVACLGSAALPALADPPQPAIGPIQISGGTMSVRVHNMRADAYYTVLTAESLSAGFKPMLAVRATTGDAANGKSFNVAIGTANAMFVRVDASDAAYSDGTGTSVWKPYAATMTQRGGMELEKVYGAAITSGNSYTQQVCVFKMKTDGAISKLVTWAMSSNGRDYTRGTLTAIAQNYERQHPGWIVLGGINADQYFEKYGNGIFDGSVYVQPQPYYPLVMDYGKRLAVSVTGNATQVVGFKNDGSENGLVTASGGEGRCVLSILGTGDAVLMEYAVANINSSPSSGKTAVWASIHATNASASWPAASVSTSNTLFVVDGDLAYLSNCSGYSYANGSVAGRNSFFGIGTVTNVAVGPVSDVAIQAGNFGIETSDPALLAALANGRRVRVEQKFGNAEMNVVEAASGFHSEHIVEGVEQTDRANDSYNTMHYSRSMFGMTTDGTYCLITADIKNGYGGLTFKECNALARGCDLRYLYQQDGGGSVTAVLRTSAGSFQVVNTPRDGTPRSVLSALLFVTKTNVSAASPEITSHPQGLTVTPGDSATFMVAAKGSRPLYYQWLFHGTNLAGASASSYTLANVHPDDAGPYSVIVSNAQGSTLSADALLTVGPSNLARNGSFETPLVANWAYQSTGGAANTYNFNAATGFAWSLGASAGIDHNSGTWYSVAAPNGSQAVFIQGANGTLSSVAQSLQFSEIGSYTIAFQCVGRAGSGPNTIQVQVDGGTIVTIGHASQSQSEWQSFTATYNCTQAGTHTLAFVGTRGGGDYSSCIDNVRVTRDSAP